MKPIKKLNSHKNMKYIFVSALQKNYKEGNKKWTGGGRIAVDCFLFASNTLPPHVISVPDYVSNLMQCISDEVPLLDLAGHIKVSYNGGVCR